MDTEPGPPRLNDLAACRFPLVARSQVISRPLPTRIGQIETRTAQAQRGGPDAVLRAAEALNLAALLASDVGIPGLADDLCRRQFDLIHKARPFPAATAKLALQPIINLARLHTRAGDGRTAFQLLHDLFAAVTGETAINLDGRPVDLADLTRGGDDQREIRTWLWEVLLADGMRALARAGDWNQALDHAKQLRGVGLNLGDGRQIAILARIFDQQHTAALELLRASDLTDSWQETVAACLTVLCLRAAGQPDEDTAWQMADGFLRLDCDLTLVTVTSRLGLTVLDLLDRVPSVDAYPVLERLAAMASAPGGGYAARDLLRHGASVRLPEARQQQLAAAVGFAGLDSGGIPNDLNAKLFTSVKASEAVLVRELAPQPVWK